MQNLLNKALMVQSHKRGVNSAPNNSITNSENNLNPSVNNHEGNNKTLFQSAKKFNVESHIENNFCVI